MKLPIYLIESADRQVLAETFMRFQEHYESPVFKGKYFSVEEFSAWYTDQYGSFSYSHDWSGFNIPSWVIEPFRNGDFGTLSEKEQRLIDVLKGKNINNCYIIGATPQDDWFNDTVKHEFVHGAFYTDKNYRNDVIDLIKNKKLKKIKNALIGMGYGKDVLDDESNAYLLTEYKTLAGSISLAEGATLRNLLNHIFIKYFGFSMVTTSADNLMRRVSKISI